MQIQNVRLAISVVCLTVGLLAQASYAQGINQGGGVLNFYTADPLQYQLWREAARNKVELYSQSYSTSASELVKYIDPIGNGGINANGQTIVHYVDNDPSGAVLDWNCGFISFDPK